MTNKLRTVVMLILAALVATSLCAQTEEPNWQDLMTHRIDPEGSTFPKETADAVLKAIVFQSKTLLSDSIKVTNLVGFCVELPYKRCFAVALYTVDPTVNYLDEMQFLVWLDRIPDGRSEYRRFWEYRTEAASASGSLSLVDAPSTIFTTPCVLAKTVDDSNAAHAASMKMFCLNQSDYPEILWEYDGDFTHESLAQAFQKSMVIFRDVDDDEIKDLILDTVEGYQAGFDKGDSAFQIITHRMIFYYSHTANKFLGTGIIPVR